MAEETAPTTGTEEPNETADKGFEAITSQEALDKIIQSRVARVKATPPADYEELKSAKAELEQIKESQKTEDQKRLDRIADLEKELGAYKQREQVTAWAAEIVKDSPVPASALRGSTREDLEAHFEELKALIPAPKPKATPPGKSPQERDKPGGAVAALRALRNG